MHSKQTKTYAAWPFHLLICCTEYEDFNPTSHSEAQTVDLFLIWPGARSLAWLDERASGRLWRSRFIRLKPMGISGSDMVSRFSADAKDTLLAWSARAGCVGLSRVTRGVRVCKTQDKKLGEVKKEYRWFSCDGNTVFNGLKNENTCKTSKRKNKNKMFLKMNGNKTAEPESF